MAESITRTSRTETSVARRTGGCGCGGGTSKATSKCGCGNKGSCGCGGQGSCGCGSKSCQACAEATYVRPNFFEGQLLTEDDLQSIVNYTVDKNRLHNRYLWGEGISCGLEVIPDRCSPGNVVVQPGYALDCCGNDLVLTCPAPLNLGRMVADLRRKLGVDCGEDCPPQQQRPPLDDVSGNNGEAKDRNKYPDRPKTYRYSLYMRYCETKTDPVAPYNTGGACGDAGCQTTRVQEGVRFELDCYTEPCPPDSIVKRICCCLEAGATEQQEEAAAQHLEMFRHKMSQRVSSLGHEHRYDTEALKTALQQVKKYTSSRAAANFSENLDEGIEATTELLARYAAYYSLPADMRKESSKEDAALLAASSKAFSSLSTKIEKNIPEGLPPLQKAEIEALKSELKTWGDTAPEKEVDSSRVRLMSAGILPSDALWRTMAEFADHRRTNLLKATELTPESSAPELAEAISSVTIPDYTYVHEGRPSSLFVNVRNVEGIVRAVDTVERVSRNLALACFCRNVNPPCPPCDDPRVLLASFEWADCRVVNICPTGRKYLWTQNNITYWLPWLEQFQSAILSLCCSDPCGEQRTPSSLYQNFGTGTSLAVMLYLSVIGRACRQRDIKYTDQIQHMASSQHDNLQSIFAGNLDTSLSSLGSMFFKEMPAVGVAPDAYTSDVHTMAARTEETKRYMEMAMDDPAFREKIKAMLANS